MHDNFNCITVNFDKIQHSLNKNLSSILKFQGKSFNKMVKIVSGGPGSRQFITLNANQKVFFWHYIGEKITI